MNLTLKLNYSCQFCLGLFTLLSTYSKEITQVLHHLLTTLMKFVKLNCFWYCGKKTLTRTLKYHKAL